MDYFLTIGAVIIFVESRVQSEINYNELEEATGFSLSHLRSTFAKTTGKSLSRYIVGRRVANAAFDIIHSHMNILDIAEKYQFSNPDTFTRAFNRVTGFTPLEFRKRRIEVGRMKLCAGVYGVSERMERMKSEQLKATEDSTVLYGVPRVGYGSYQGCTPYPICLKACANYLGEDIDYDYVMAVCGAAFRLTWDVTCWNAGNVDACFTFDEWEKVYRLGIEGLGYGYEAIRRTEDTKKEDFIRFIKEKIDKGIPCIAAGIIGPPEACIITGYRDNGDTLLGWNFFQDNPEFGGNVETHESGYFISKDWWENPDTVSVIGMGEKTGEKMSIDGIVKNAVEVLSGRQTGNYAKGIQAYDAWKKAVTDDGQFKDNAIMPIMAERLMCQGDAMDCLMDGRWHASEFFKKQAEEQPGNPFFIKLAEKFGEAAAVVIKISEVLGGWERTELQMRNLYKPENRKKIGELIDTCKAADEEALSLLGRLQDFNRM
ncbi:helix-turn-helix transcriptional regulator [Anaerocolumna xylanovorans]|uniref:AraC-type DNA-binding protein n=1 Tax=Anaerocolumna xylanovorans DSM 12503 TaxID=1121345 RepID=A0A1M7Y588_9FIRM|nr:helix-turn-helix transcriptional regulator [Anaerocolumna xylanovorans]SHO47415.1 AraC-type DNA-binding protein [Anaerocolumna xylanovorans DSM 12503]